MKRLLCTVIAALAFAGAAFAVDWDIHDINVNVRLYRDGSAIVSETWNLTAQEGTEVYVPRTNLGDIEISGLSVSDETGEMYVFENHWDTDRSLDRKAGRCGFNRISGGVELCWGLGSYGTHTYKVRYKMSNVVKSLQDYDMLHLQLVNDEMAAPPEHVKVTVEAQDAQIDTSWVRIWGFGFAGFASFEDGKAVYESSEHFRYESSVIALMRFDKGVFEPESIEDRPFQEVLDRAMDGSDYRHEDAFDWMDKIINVIMMIFSFLMVLVVFLFPFLRMVKGDKLSRRQKRKILGGPADKVDWYRDLPLDGDIYETDHILDLLETRRQSNSVASAIILRLIERGYLRVTKDEKDKVEISFDDTKDITQLDMHERGLYDMMKEASGADLVLQDKEFSRWSQRSRNQDTIRLWASGIDLGAKRRLREKGLLTGKKFSEKGKQEARKVMGFKNFLRDFTLSSERESVEVGLWKDYLVFASLFGIADKVAKELKDIDPQVFAQVMAFDYMTLNQVMRMTDSLARSITNARYVPQTISSTGGGFGGFGGGTSFGGGGGFSGGGHGGGVR